MKQENKKPLYKVLNEQRTQGEWVVFEEGTMGEDRIIATPTPKDGGDIIFEAPDGWESSMRRWKANSEYTALCVNNLHHLAEALEDILKAHAKGENINIEILAAKEALNRIS